VGVISIEAEDGCLGGIQPMRGNAQVLEDSAGHDTQREPGIDLDAIDFG